MSDEIDIEEHNLFDHPTIKRIFPDLTVVKQEISQYEQGLDASIPEVKQESSEYFIPRRSPGARESRLKNTFNVDSPNNLEDPGPENCDRYFQPNVIILGSKPDVPPKQKGENKPTICNAPKVVLKNINVYLNKSDTYCKKCYILFSNRKKFVDHVKIIHNLTKSNFSDNKNKNVKKSLPISKYKCDCNSTFSSRSNFDRHIKHIHKNISKNKETINESKVPKPILNNVSKIIETAISKNNKIVSKDYPNNTHILDLPDKNYSCFHCHKLFHNEKFLIDHLYEVLQPKIIQSEKSAMNFSTQDRLEQHKISVHNEKITATEVVQHNKEGHRNIINRSMTSDNTINKSDHNKANNEITESDEPIKIKTMKQTVLQKELAVVVTKLAQNVEHKLKHKNKIKYADTTSKIPNYQKCDANASDHNLSIHSKEDYLDLPKEIDLISEKPNKFQDKKISVEKAYQCFICSQYKLTFSCFIKHMAKKHKMTKVLKIKKVLFDSQCKFCSSKLVNMHSYNSHIVKYHESKITLQNEKINMEVCQLEQTTAIIDNSVPNSYAFKNVLYKCAKCDIHFMTEKTAINHSDHMEILINWKCFICSRIFKKLDKFLHIKQHSYSHSFTVYNLCESNLNQVLYICLKCTIHFTEERFVHHYPVCEDLTPDSVYCKICDNLINRSDFDIHDQIHTKNKHLTALDFTIVETNMIISNDTSSNIVESKNDIMLSNKIDLKGIIHDKCRYYITFCHTCQSFMTNIGSTRKTHLEGRCVHIKKHVCKECGLVFTMQASKSHKKLHREVKNLNIKKFFFYDLQSKKQICPPIPDYPDCNVCGVHFLSRSDVIEHECDGYKHVVCHVCEIKLSVEAFKFHLQFHEYEIKNSKETVASITEPMSKTINTVPNLSKISGSIKETDSLEMPFMFCCIICKVIFDAYDNVVKHNHTHFDSKKNTIATQSCIHCSLIFEKNSYETHEKIHSCKNFDAQSIKIIHFDPIYFSLDNKIWLKHIFRFLSDHEIDKVLHNSMYRYEGRLKMELFMPGPSMHTLYKCEKCLAIIDPEFLYIHSENIECTQIRKHPCSKCELYFDSSKYKMDHEKNHDHKNMSLKSYRIVVINKEKDELFHKIMFKSRKKFVLYLCRNCNVTFDKVQSYTHGCKSNNLILKCSYCCLNFYKENYDIHISRHNELKIFDTEHINVVLFGNTPSENTKKVQSFSGKIYDYTFYKCKSCELCIRTKNSTSPHKCVFDDSKSKCFKCGLYFIKQELSSHDLLHEIDQEFGHCLNIITFDANANVEKDFKLPKENNESFSSPNIKSSYKIKEPIKEHLIRVVKIYRCGCDLNFLDESNARHHFNSCNPKKKTSKQCCSKCEMLFTPEELFTHLLSHHGDKNIEFNFNIVSLSTVVKRNKIYKCIKCNLHFVYEMEVNEHLSKCDESGLGGEKCKKCGLRFNFSSLYKNKHKKVCERKYEINVVSELKKDTNSAECIENNEEPSRVMDDVVTEMDMVLARDYSISRENLSKIDLSKYDNVLYKCNVCNVHYLIEDTRRRHKHFASVFDSCSICGLNFSLQSLTKHKYIHHEMFNLKKDEFEINSSDA